MLKMILIMMGLTVLLSACATEAPATKTSDIAFKPSMGNRLN